LAVFGFLATGASAARAGSDGAFPFLFFFLEEDDGFFLAGAVAGASVGFSGTGIGATALATGADGAVMGAAAGCDGESETERR
jgi:hypothetical protein